MQGTIAPDYSRFERRKKAIEQPVPLELVEQPILKRTPEKTAMPYKTLLGFAVATVLLAAVIFSYNQLWNANAVNTSLEKQYQTLKDEEQGLLQKARHELSLREIATIAGQEYGMIAPSADQIVYVEMNGQDSAEVYREDSIFAQIGRWLSGIFS